MSTIDVLELCIRFIVELPLDRDHPSYPELLDIQCELNKQLEEKRKVQEAYGRAVEAMEAIRGYPVDKVKGEK